MTRQLTGFGLLLAALTFGAWTTGGSAAARGADAPATGMLSVTSQPAGAAVYIDGAYAGRTPFSTSTIAVGDHRVRVNRDGYLENSRVVAVTSARAERLDIRLTAVQQAAPAAAGLKIVVITGEDAVNVIQQKTAVAPIIEVRDRNDQPIAGALVRFSISGGRASFANGGQILSITTNAAGRAAVTGITPTAAGAVQINVAATYAGQAATATMWDPLESTCRHASLSIL